MKFFALLALLASFSISAFADTSDKWAGSWRPLDAVFGELTFTLTEVGAGKFRLTGFANGKILDYGTTNLTKTPSGLAGACGPLTKFSLVFPIPGNDQAEFALNKHYCPNGTVQGKVNHLTWSYDSMTSSDNGLMKDVMMMATLKFVE